MRGLLCLLSIYLISFSFAGVPVIEFQNEEIRSGETILAKITVDSEFAKEIELGDIKFFEDRKSVFFESKIFFYEGVHYLAAYSTRTGNFALEVQNILFKEDGVLKSHKISVPLNIISPEIFSEDLNKTIKQVLSIKPGNFYSIEKPSIKLTNKGDSYLEVNYLDSAGNLSSGESIDIILEPTEIFSILKISSYKDFEIPIVYLLGNESEYNAPEEQKIKTNPELVFANIISGESEDLILQLFNFDESNVTSISLSTTSDFVEIGKFEETLVGKGILNISLALNPETEGILEGFLNLTYNQNERDWSLDIPMTIYSLPKGSNESDFEVVYETCSEIGGQDCGSDICSGTAKFTKDGTYCCLGECKIVDLGETGSSGSGWIWGLVILIVLGGVGYYFYKKSKKVGPGSTDDKLKKTSEDYSKKMNPIEPPKRVSGDVQRNL